MRDLSPTPETTATGSPSGIAFKIDNASKRYGDLVALDGVDLDIPEGQVRYGGSDSPNYRIAG